MAEPSASESSADSDQDFDPTAEMLVNDFDDEHTLEEQEAMESAESVTNELVDLQRESEMPLNEVLAMYGYKSNAEYDDTLQEVPEQNSDSSGDSSKQLMNNTDSNRFISREIMQPISDVSPNNEPNKVDLDIDLVFYDDSSNIPRGSSRPLLRSVHHHQASGDSSDTGTDYEYSPDDDWRKTIQVGPDFQAVIPEGLSQYDDAPAYENEDRLLWDPLKLPDEEVEDYLRQFHMPKTNNGVSTIPAGAHVRDDEQALFLLLQCGYNKEEALRRRRMHPLPPADTMSLWSEDECRSFETGLKTYGKDFHLIQMNKVRTRAVGELAQFYYLWKKTERHDVFVTKNRLEKKKYALHPGCTDYMDRFLDELENPSSTRDRSSSPSSNNQGGNRSGSTSPEPNADSSTPELSVSNHGVIDAPSSTGTFTTGTVSASIEHEHTHCKNSSENECSKDCLNDEDQVSSTTPSPKE